MYKPKLCIIYVYCGKWFSWDEHGRMICARETKEQLLSRLYDLGYRPAHPLSRFACNVRDRMRFRFPSLLDEIEKDALQ